MNSLVSYFGAAFLINLPERKDRLISATKELARVGWTLGPTSVQIYAARKFTERGGFPGNPSVRGCFHSHLECIRNADREDKKSVLLIEDDITLSSSLCRLSPSIISQLNSVPWDFIYFGHECTGDIARANSRTSSVTIMPIATEIRTTHFFAINRRVFKRLLAHLDRVMVGPEGDQEFGPMPIDGAFNVFRRINVDVQTYIANPKLGWQRPSRSEITPRFFDNLRSIRPFVTMLRNIKHSSIRWRS